jgi:hypothetical protein
LNIKDNIIVTKNDQLRPDGAYITLTQYLLSEQRNMLLIALNKYKWNYTEAGKAIGLTFREIRYRIEKCGLHGKEFGGKTTPYPDRKKSMFSKLWPRLRYQALQRDKGRCQLCGVTARDGARMHVDHIRPKKHFPELAIDINNLQVLCDKCNLSKSDGLEHL